MKLGGKSGKIISKGCYFPPKFVNPGTMSSIVRRIEDILGCLVLEIQKKIFVKLSEKITEEKQSFESMALCMLKSLGQVQLWGHSVRATSFLGGSGKVLGIGKGRNFAIVKNEVLLWSRFREKFN